MFIKCNGYKLNNKAIAEINKLKKGQAVVFKDFLIKQKGVPTYKPSQQTFFFEIE